MDPVDEIGKLLQLPQTLQTGDLDRYIEHFLGRKADKELALHELDNQIALLSNLVLLLSLHLKQKYLLGTPPPQELRLQASDLLTRKEVARRFKVDEKTVANWIKAGLEVIEIGGISRISEDALQRFMETHKTKKLNWSSVGNRKAA